jgi:hypothetical protein
MVYIANEARHTLRMPVKVPTEDVTNIEVHVDYQKGGTNMLTGDFNAGGIYAYVSPLAIKDGFETRVLFRGRKVRLVECNRLNRKAIARLFAEVKAAVDAKLGTVWDCILKVCGEEKVEV